MAVTGVLGVAIEVPDHAVGRQFYTDAGLEAETADGRIALRCAGNAEPSVTLIEAAGPMRLHHVGLRAGELDAIAARVPGHGGKVVAVPTGFGGDGLWIEDIHGVLFHLVDKPAVAEAPVAEPFAINAPGRVVRVRRSAMQPVNSYPPVRPRRLGHVALFTPDVAASAGFLTGALGMAVADSVADVLAFCCAAKDSDHHVIALAKSSATGMHHLSFQVADPDEVGRGGNTLAAKAGKGQWGFGRHTIGSNFFHYIQDPWGSWFEYYSDMDFIDDHALWQATSYGMEDALANWGPPPPADFIHNYQAGPAA